MLLMDEPLTVREICERFGIARTRLYYRIELLEQHGFIRVVAEETVSWNVERAYRAVARHFRVDPGLFSKDSPEAIADARAVIVDAVGRDLRVRKASPHQTDDFVSRGFLRLTPARLPNCERRF
ncbi:MAG: helix-turn-helix domain-containing protein [Candidatus Eremiobacteraeota bacterium]|nr:helix-turn-helix domain-containing protein [Candidatus Eremiobacteraeota bacterium]